MQPGLTEFETAENGVNQPLESSSSELVAGVEHTPQRPTQMSNDAFTRGREGVQEATTVVQNKAKSSQITASKEALDLAKPIDTHSTTSWATLLTQFS